MGHASEWVAAVAAIAAAGVVAVQSWWTRRSAQAAERAVDAADRAVVAANEGLELSRQQTSEAVRARIDAATPQITVLVPEYPTWPPAAPPLAPDGNWVEYQVGDGGEEFYLPQDAQRRIVVQAPVTIVNDSTAHVDVELYQLATMEGVVGDQTVRLRPGEPWVALLQVDRTLKEWVAIYQERSAGKPGPETGGTVRYMDPADTGAIDSWPLVIGGCPVEPVPGREGPWRIAVRPDDRTGAIAAMRLGPALRERFYYLSKRRSEKLP